MYSLEPEVFVDERQHEFEIECTADATWVISVASTGHAREQVGALAWSGVRPRSSAPSGPEGTPPAATANPVDAASRVVADMRQRFRRCYNKELERNPDLKVNLRGSVEMLEDGSVGDVDLVPSGLSKDLTDCLTAVIKSSKGEPGPRRIIRLGQ